MMDKKLRHIRTSLKILIVIRSCKQEFHVLNRVYFYVKLQQTGPNIILITEKNKPTRQKKIR